MFRFSTYLSLALTSSLFCEEISTQTDVKNSQEVAVTVAEENTVKEITKSSDDFSSLFDDEAPQAAKPQKTYYQEESNTSYNQPSRSADHGMMSQEEMLNPSKNHFMVYGDFLYWQPFVNDATWAQQSTTDANYNLSAINYSFDFSWDYGFRVGALYKTRWESLIFDANWTHFYTTSTNTVQNSFGLSVYNIPAFSTSDPFSKANASYNLKFDQFDFCFNKPVMLTKRFNLMPFIGARGLVIQHKLNVSQIITSQDPNITNSINQKNNTYGIGLVSGLNSRIKLGKGFGFHAGGDFFIGYGSNNSYLTQNYTQQGAEVDTTYSDNFTQKTNSTKSMLDVMAGLDWHNQPTDESFDFFVSAGYEFIYIFNSPTFINPSILSQNLSQNFGFQGLTVRAGFGF